MGSNTKTRRDHCLLFASLSVLSWGVLHNETLHQDLSEIINVGVSGKNGCVKKRDKEGKRTIKSVSSGKAPGEESGQVQREGLWKQSKSHLRVVPGQAEAGVFTHLRLAEVG